MFRVCDYRGKGGKAQALRELYFVGRDGAIFVYGQTKVYGLCKHKKAESRQIRNINNLTT